MSFLGPLYAGKHVKVVPKVAGDFWRPLQRLMDPIQYWHIKAPAVISHSNAPITQIHKLMPEEGTRLTMGSYVIPSSELSKATCCPGSTKYLFVSKGKVMRVQIYKHL